MAYFARQQILVVDNDEASRWGLVTLLANGGYHTAEAANADEALVRMRTESPDAVVLETHLGATSGYALCRSLRDRYGDDLPIVFVSRERTTATDQVAGLLVGADGYVPQPVERDLLLALLGRLLARSGARTRHERGPLTTREGEVLALLAQGRTQREIADGLSVSPKTVGKHVEHIIAKLGVHSRAQAVAEAYRRGLVAPGDFEAHAVDARVAARAGTSRPSHA